MDRPEHTWDQQQRQQRQQHPGRLRGTRVMNWEQIRDWDSPPADVAPPPAARRRRLPAAAGPRLRGQQSSASSTAGTGSALSYLIQGCLVPKGGLTAEQGGYEKSDVLIADGHIVSVTTDSAAAVSTTAEGCTVVDGTDKLLLPGLHNAHTHSNFYWAKGGIAPLPLELMVAIPTTETPLKPGDPRADLPMHEFPADIVERYRIGALATGLHNLMSGGTSLIDMISLPEGDNELTMACLHAAAQGYRESGVRCFLGPQFHDTVDDSPNGGYTANYMACAPVGCALPSYLEGLASDGSLRDQRAPLDPAKTKNVLGLWRRAIEELHCPEEGLSIILSPHNELTCSVEMFEGCAQIMRDHPTVHATCHLLEGLHQPISSDQRYGVPAEGEPTGSLVALDKCGFLTPRVTFAHAVHLRDADRALLAARGCTVSHNPISNCRLGAGVADVPAMLEAGISVGLGVDGAGSGVDSQDILEAAKFACLIHNPQHQDYRKWLTPRKAM